MAKKEINFTKKEIAALPIPGPGKRTEFYDSKTPGLIIRITSTGSTTFCVYKKVRGKPQRIKIGNYPETTIGQARIKAKIKLGQMAEGRDLAEQKRNETRNRRKTQAKRIALEEAFEAYLISRTLKPRTEQDYREAMRVTFKDWLDKPLKSITRTMVEELHRKRSKVSESRANHAMRVLRAVFNHAIETIIDEDEQPVFHSNPVKRLSAVKAWNPNTRKQNYVKEHQLPAWFDAVINLKGDRDSLDADLYRDYFQFLLLTGLRKNEAARLDWGDVDLDDRSFLITDTKNRDPHRLPISDYLLRILIRRKRNTGYVFATNRSPGYPVDMRQAIDRVSAVCGVDWTLHDLRRTFVTAAEMLDISAYSIKRLVNHRVSKADVTDGYIMWDVERLRAPMQSITDYFLKAGNVIDTGIISIDSKCEIDR